MFLISKKYWIVRETYKKGKGVFARRKIPGGEIIGDYVGKLLPLEKIDFKKEKEGLYLMNYSDDIGIYPNLKKEGVHLLNHSCKPNCFIYKYLKHTLVFALRDINKDEELTISYLLPPKTYCSPCNHKCVCGNKNCSGNMHLSENKYKKWLIFQKNNFKENSSSTKRAEVRKLRRYPQAIPKNFIDKVVKIKIF